MVRVEDLDDFYYHIMRGYETTEMGLNHLLDNGLVKPEEYIKLHKENFKRYQERAEEFAKSRWGRSWKQALEETKTKIEKADI